MMLLMIVMLQILANLVERKTLIAKENHILRKIRVIKENQEKIFFDCKHSICLVCYSKLLQTDNAVCPICRKKVDNYFI